MTEVSAHQRSASDAPPRGIKFRRCFSRPDVHPYEHIQWERRTAVILGPSGERLFEQQGVEMPSLWSQQAVNIVVSKYFSGPLGSPERETSLRQMIDRVVGKIATWGEQDGYFKQTEDRQIFADELTAMMVNQMAAFNSPVWFNVGVQTHPQCSACFINGVEDSMDSVMGLAQTEARLFRHGSGTGTNLSPLRGRGEPMSTGGTAAGPVSFMRGYDAFAGVVKSGGRTRRAAKMVLLDADHPDVLEFIDCKMVEEKKARVLIEAGYDGGLDGAAYASVSFQNANNTVRVTDDFMQAVADKRPWKTFRRVDGAVAEVMDAKSVLEKIAQAAFYCGDPGLQFDTTINSWHTCKATDRIKASNPCSEFMFLDDTACNLASMNLIKFRDNQGRLDVDAFCHGVDVLITAMDVLVDRSGYPTERITKNSRSYRPLGLGYANLGGFLMASGMPYDSDRGRAVAASITSLMTARAYRQSAELARVRGPFDGFERNRESMELVLQRHRSALFDVDKQQLPAGTFTAMKEQWDEALRLGQLHGYRNAQATVLAPTGTIGFMMDCNTTGIEPDLALVKVKRLVGGGVLRMVNGTVGEGLMRLGYSEGQRTTLLNHVEHHGTLEGAAGIEDRHLSVFDCALQNHGGNRVIEPMGHLKMMAAVQPFLSGAISKTINLPGQTSQDDIFVIYQQAWRLGLKSIAVYRDGCKKAQPMSPGGPGAKECPSVSRQPALSSERQAITHNFSVGGHQGYLTVGLYDDGSPGELFVRLSKQGSTMSGLMDSLATSISLALQHGVPLSVLVDKFVDTRFEPNGPTTNDNIPVAKSILDYIFRWLADRFLSGHHSTMDSSAEPADGRNRAGFFDDTLTCGDCGGEMVPNGACYRCGECGSSSGCS